MITKLGLSYDICLRLISVFATSFPPKTFRRVAFRRVFHLVFSTSCFRRVVFDELFSTSFPRFTLHQHTRVDLFEKIKSFDSNRHDAQRKKMQFIQFLHLNTELFCQSICAVCQSTISVHVVHFEEVESIWTCQRFDSTLVSLLRYQELHN